VFSWLQQGCRAFAKTDLPSAKRRNQVWLGPTWPRSWSEAVPNRSRKLESIHAAGHLDISEYNRDVQASFEDCSGFVRARRFDHFKRLFDHFDGVHPDQKFISTIRITARFATGIIEFVFPIHDVRALPPRLSVGYRTFGSNLLMSAELVPIAAISQILPKIDPRRRRDYVPLRS
jgi:hypothetical protein